MITAEKVGRDLHLTMDGVEKPFIIHPLPGKAGIQITDTYLATLDNRETGEMYLEALQMAVDGAVFDAERGRWVPVPEDQQVNFARFGTELSQAESEAIIMPAFFWQSILGMDGVRAYIEGGEGIAGTLKASGALSSRLGLWARMTSPSTASGNPTSTASTRTTSTRPGGGRPAKRSNGKKRT